MGNKNKISYKNYLKKQKGISSKPKEATSYHPTQPWNFERWQNWNERRFKEVVLQNFKNKRFRTHHQMKFIEQDGSDIFFSIVDEKRKIHHFVRVRDTSTGAYHLLRVPEHMNSCREAIAWTFGMSESEYELIKEA